MDEIKSGDVLYSRPRCIRLPHKSFKQFYVIRIKACKRICCLAAGGQVAGDGATCCPISNKSTYFASELSPLCLFLLQRSLLLLEFSSEFIYFVLGRFLLLMEFIYFVLELSPHLFIFLLKRFLELLDLSRETILNMRFNSSLNNAAETCSRTIWGTTYTAWIGTTEVVNGGTTRILGNASGCVPAGREGTGCWDIIGIAGRSVFRVNGVTVRLTGPPCR
mmetsp:Transcript_28697/g.63766  ORF Transcript_28697/g.63766 Transcript_28697/m.63766 type:complete len:220 (+) Transcript_28697:839-1498(+)